MFVHVKSYFHRQDRQEMVLHWAHSTARKMPHLLFLSSLSEPLRQQVEDGVGLQDETRLILDGLHGTALHLP